MGMLEAGRLADVIVLERDPLADIRVLQGGQHLAWVIKDGKIVDLGDRPLQERPIAFEAVTPVPFSLSPVPFATAAPTWAGHQSTRPSS
jgi:hypothetical protein